MATIFWLYGIVCDHGDDGIAREVLENGID